MLINTDIRKMKEKLGFCSAVNWTQSLTCKQTEANLHQATSMSAKCNQKDKRAPHTSENGYVKARTGTGKYIEKKEPHSLLVGMWTGLVSANVWLFLEK